MTHESILEGIANHHELDRKQVEFVAYSTNKRYDGVRLFVRVSNLGTPNLPYLEAMGVEVMRYHADPKNPKCTIMEAKCPRWGQES